MLLFFEIGKSHTRETSLESVSEYFFYADEWQSIKSTSYNNNVLSIGVDTNIVIVNS